MSAATRGARIARLSDGCSVVAWSREAVALRLQEAARTLRALPAAGCSPRGVGAHWPEVIRGFWEVWNGLDSEAERRRHAAARHVQASRPVAPSAAAIDAMDEALRWLGWIEDRRHVRLLWALALGVKPGRLARELGVSRQTVNVWQRAALEQLVRRLNEQRKNIRNGNL